MREVNTMALTSYIDGARMLAERIIAAAAKLPKAA